MQSSSKNRSEEHVNLVHSLEEAQFIFRTIFKDYDESTLTDGILLWLGQMKDPVCFQLFLSLPELMKQHSLSDFLESRVDLPQVRDKHNIRIVGVAAGVFSLISICWELFGKKLHEEPSGRPEENEEDLIHEIIEAISLSDIQQVLSASLVSIVGEKYHDLFLDKLKPFEHQISIPETIPFREDPALAEHMQLMLWFGLMRCFLDAVYFCFRQKPGK